MNTIRTDELIKMYQELVKVKEEVIKLQEKKIKDLETNRQPKIIFSPN